MVRTILSRIYISTLVVHFTLFYSVYGQLFEQYEVARNWTKVIRIGFMSASIEAELGSQLTDKLIGGSLLYAVEKINNDTRRIPGYKLEVVRVETHGIADFAINQTVEVCTMRDDIDILFGVGKNCRTQARIASVYNVPMISHNCIDEEVSSDKIAYATFARTKTSQASIARAGVTLLRHFNWTQHITLLWMNEGKRIVAETASLFKQLAETVPEPTDDLYPEIPFINITQEKAIKHPAGLSFGWFFSFPDNVDDNQAYWGPILQDVEHKSRIFVYICSLPDEALSLAYTMYTRGLFDNGEYQLIILETVVRNKYNQNEYIYDSWIRVLRLSEEGRKKYLGFFHWLQRNMIIISNTVAVKDKDLMLKVFWYNRFWVEGWESAYERKVKEQDLPTTFITADNYNIYDAAYVYANALEKVIAAGENITDGRMLFSYIQNSNYFSGRGYNMHIDYKGDAEGNFTVFAYQNNSRYAAGTWPVGHFQYYENQTIAQFFVNYTTMQWISGKKPLDMPLCGFDNEFCMIPEPIGLYITCGVLGFLFLVAVMVGSSFYRQWKYEQELDKMMWRVEWDDVVMAGADMANSKLGSVFGSRILSKASLAGDGALDVSDRQTYITLATYKGAKVAVKKINKKSIELSRDVKKELKLVRDIRSENLVSFIGACIDHPNICILYEYCQKGSLQDVLANDDVSIDNMFVASMINDIMKGLNHLFTSAVQVHGNLKSSNCLIDGRWVVKLSDFGLRLFKELDSKEIERQKAESSHAYFSAMFWTAPEHLREENRTYTEKGDIYSFAIILYEVHARAGPYDDNDDGDSPFEIITKLRKVIPGVKPFRPKIATLDTTPKFVTDVIQECWQEDPGNRPDLKNIQSKLKPMQKGLKPNIMDNMISIMERYANNLEGIIAERTEELVKEKKKTDELLYQMLPRSVAEQLKQGKRVEAEAFNSVTIYFSDICGFTALSAESTPIQVVDLLNDLYTCFDSILDSFDVYKVETIGDAYMVVSGLPIRNGNRHAGEIAQMSLKLLEAIHVFKVRHKPGYTMQLRIGIHTGSVVSGVVGLRMPRYCLFGDTVNTASRMESNGLPLRIHCSPECREILEVLGGYAIEERGLVAMKGKGEILTYWINGYTKM